VGGVRLDVEERDRQYIIKLVVVVKAKMYWRFGEILRR